MSVHLCWDRSNLQLTEGLECLKITFWLSGKNLEYFLERNYQTLQDKTKEMKIKQKACRQKNSCYFTYLYLFNLFDV